MTTIKFTKLPEYLDNPFDVYMRKINIIFFDFFKKLNLTPNHLTFMSFISGLYAVYFFYYNNVSCIIFYIISWFFDAADGYYARTYNMCSKYGDIFDHVTDWITNGGYIILIIDKSYKKLSFLENFIIIYIIIFIMLFGQILFFACQEKYYNKLSNIPSLGFLTNIIHDRQTARKLLPLIRFAGPGTAYFLMIIITLYIISA